MKKIQGIPDQIRQHYEIEKNLASRLRNATREERQFLYTSLYDELFRSVSYHPQLAAKSSPKQSAKKVAYQIGYIHQFLTKDTTFLEIGPGDCALSFEVAKRVKMIYAVDVSKEITKNLSVPLNFKLILSDGASIPVPIGSVDVAYSNQLMEHLHPDDALEQLHNIFVSLSSRGIYICLTPNRLDGPHDISRYFDSEATGFHLHEYTVTELHRLFLKTGFSKVKIFITLNKKNVYVPVAPVILCERILSMFPNPLRKVLASSWPVTNLLGIRLVGYK